MEDGNSEKEIVVDPPVFLETPYHLVTDHLVETQEWTFLFENPVAEEPKRTFMDPVAVVGFGWWLSLVVIVVVDDDNNDEHYHYD